jgi:hypothetical protein
VEDAVQTWLAGLERQLADGPVPELPVLLAYAAGRDVRLDDDELNAALRRTMLILAAGGDPHRELDPAAPAVASLAAELDDERPRTELMRGLDDLVGRAARLPRVRGALLDLAARPAATWRAFACALLAEELGEET